MNIKISEKHLQIDKAQSTIVAVIASTTIVTVFCLMSSRALLAKASYQHKVINEKQKAAKQLAQNVKDAQTFLTQYNDVFNGSGPTNIIGGRNTTDPNAKPPDGNNSHIVLDALPTTYDFPALVTSIASILQKDAVASPAIVGLDSSTTADNTPSPNPQPVKIPITISGTTTYDGAKSLFQDLERSIRPFDVSKLSISGTGAINVSLDANTYYQPAKSLTITNREIK
jgi:hypothetical protein